MKILRPNCLQIYLCRWQIWLFYFHGTLLFPSTWFRIKSIYLGRGGGIFPWFKAHPFDYFLVAHNKTKVPLFFSKWEIRTEVFAHITLYFMVHVRCIKYRLLTVYLFFMHWQFFLFLSHLRECTVILIHVVYRSFYADWLWSRFCCVLLLFYRKMASTTAQKKMPFSALIFTWEYF